MRQRMIYIMNVDWDWVKQRPHFIAEHLSHIYDVIIIYPYTWRRSNLSKNKRGNLQLYPFFRLPFSRRFRWVHTLNIFLLQHAARVFFKWMRADFLWISSPELFEYIPESISSQCIYDCMDDILEFPINAPRKNTLMALEKKLVHRSSLVFCSSINLHHKLNVRTGYSEKYFVAHNACEPFSSLKVTAHPIRHPERSEGSRKHNTVPQSGRSLATLGTTCEQLPLKNQKIKLQRDNNVYILGYVGTISSWMDFDALLKLVNSFPLLEIHLLGPVEHNALPFSQHHRIKLLGPIPHENLSVHIAEFDALIMPFQLTELILSVDPVKLYEYVYFDKPIISIQYPEVDKFADFVDFYTNHEELIKIVSRYFKAEFKKKIQTASRLEFMAQHTWANRVAFIKEKMDDLVK